MFSRKGSPERAVLTISLTLNQQNEHTGINLVVFYYNHKSKMYSKMKTVDTIITYLFAIIYLVFALNYFFGFLPMPPLEGDALQYMTLLGTTGYMTAVKVLELAVAIMLLLNIRRPLAWLLILPVSTNILMYDVFIVGLPTLGVLMMTMNVYMVYRLRENYACIWAK